MKFDDILMDRENKTILLSVVPHLTEIIHTNQIE